MKFHSQLFCRKDASATYLPGLPVHSIVVVVDGPTAVELLMMILLIDEPESINAPMIAGWLAILNRPCIEASAITPDQRELLLMLVCGFHAFLELPPGVNKHDFYTLAQKLVDATFDLAVLELADAKVHEVTDWLEVTLPATCFLPVLNNSYEAHDPGKQSKEELVGIMVSLASMLDPHVHEVLEDVDLAAALSSTHPPLPDITLPQPAPSSEKTKLCKSCKKSRKACAQAAEPVSDGASTTVPVPPIHSDNTATVVIDTQVTPPSPGTSSGPNPRDTSVTAMAGTPLDSENGHAAHIEEVPDIELNMHCAPVLDMKASVLEEIISDEELPDLVDIVDSSDGESSTENMVRVIAQLFRLAMDE